MERATAEARSGSASESTPGDRVRLRYLSVTSGWKCSRAHQHHTSTGEPPHQCGATTNRPVERRPDDAPSGHGPLVGSGGPQGGG